MALDTVRQDLKKLVSTQDLAVLCTHKDGQSYVQKLPDLAEFSEGPSCALF